MDEDADVAAINFVELGKRQRIRAETGLDRIAGAAEVLQEPVLIARKARGERRVLQPVAADPRQPFAELLRTGA